MKRPIINFQWLLTWLILASWIPVQAAEVSPPFFKGALKSYHHFFDDIRQIGEIASDSAFATTVELPLQLFIGADLLESLDKDAPLGFSIQKVDEDYQPLFVLPLDDASILSDFIASKNTDANVTEQENGVLLIEWGLGTLFLKTVGEWTYVAIDEDVFQNIPEEGAAFFTGMDGTISLQFDLRLLPQKVKETLLNAYTEGADLAGEAPGIPESMKEAQKRQGEVVKKSFQMLFESYSLCSFELGMNTSAKALESQVEIDVIPGCSVEQLLQKAKTIPARFSGFSNLEWTIGGYSVSPMDEELKLLQKASLENSLKLFQEGFREGYLMMGNDSDAADFFTSNEALFAQILEILKPTWECLQEENETQLGIGIQFIPKNTNGIMAFVIKDPKLVETAFQKLVDLAKEKAGDQFKEEWVKFDVQTLEGIRFHQLKITLDEILAWIPEEDRPTEEELEPFREMLGDSWEIVVGLGKDTVYLAVGNQPIPLIQQTLTPADKVYPAYTSISLSQVFDYYSILLEKSGGDAKTTSLMQIMKEILAGSEANQCVIYSEYTENGVCSKVILEEGVTRLIGSLRSIATIMAM